MKRCSKCGLEKPLDQFNRDKRLKSGRRSRCKTCESAQFARWSAENPDYYAERYVVNRERYADRDFNNSSRKRLRSPDLFIEFVERLKVFERDDWVCGICGEPIPKDLTREQYLDPRYGVMDHIIPLGKGGTHEYANVQAAHRRCNDLKWTRIVEEVAA